MTIPRTPALPSAMAALLAVMVTAGAAAGQSGGPKVAILVYDGVQVIDHAIPYEVFGQFSLSEVYTVAPDTGEVRTFMGLRILPHYTFADAPEPDLLVLPGGDTREARTDPVIVEWVRSTATSSTHVLTVCTGVFFLVGSDLLEGARITTWYDQQEALRKAAPQAEVVSDAIVVDAGKLVTAAGTGIKGALHVLEKLHGPAWREAVRLNMEHQGVPEHLHVPRASLADVNLPSGIYGAFPWREAEFVRYEGDEDRWTSEWIFEAATPPGALRTRIAAALRDEDGWEHEEIESQADGWTSRWSLEGRDGRPWEGRIRLREEGDDLRLEIEVRRSPETPGPPSTSHPGTPPDHTVSHRIPDGGISGRAAVARVEVMFDDRLAFTDYMSLYEFEDGWRIVAKIFNAELAEEEGRGPPVANRRSGFSDGRSSARSRR